MASPSASGLVFDTATLHQQQGMVVANSTNPLATPVFVSFDDLGNALTSPSPAGMVGLPAFAPVAMPAPYHPPSFGPYGRLPPLAHLNTDSAIYRPSPTQQNTRARTSSHPYAYPSYSPTHSRRDSAQSDDSEYPPSPSDRRANHRHNNSASTSATTASGSLDDEPASATNPRAKPKLPAAAAANGATQAKPSSESISVVREMTDGFSFLWMASLGRCVSPAASSSSLVEQAQVVTFPPGTWFHVYDTEREIFPWVNLNAWIKGQLKEGRQCICSFQWFKNGKELGKKGLQESAIWKRPAVLREHLAHCQKLDPSSPIVVVARWTREGDKLKGGDTRTGPARGGR